MTESLHRRGKHELDRALAGIGSSTEELWRSAEQVVLFGSRATGCANTCSDWDLLCIGEGTSRITPAIDVIWMPRSALVTKEWLGSELAGHIGAFGRWLVGHKTWWPELDTNAAATAKAQRIRQMLRSMEHSWPLLSRPYRVKHWTRLRRDLQRHELLRRGQAVVPSAWLDNAWRQGKDTRGRCLELCEKAGQSSAFLDTILIPEMCGDTTARSHQQ